MSPRADDDKQSLMAKRRIVARAGSVFHTSQKKNVGSEISRLCVFQLGCYLKLAIFTLCVTGRYYREKNLVFFFSFLFFKENSFNLNMFDYFQSSRNMSPTPPSEVSTCAIEVDFLFAV